MKSKLILSSNRNPCSICENTSGKCRQSSQDQDYWQCMNCADAKKGEIINGYKCIGTTKDNLWGQFKLDNSQEWSDQQRQEWQQKNSNASSNKPRKMRLSSGDH
jgi:hypothetical protein